MHFYMFCGALGAPPFAHDGLVVEVSIAVRALEMQRELMLLCHAKCLSMNPIAVWEWLAEGDTVAYCPFAYGYSNYSRRGYAKNILCTGGLVGFKPDDSFHSTLGGAGLAIAAGCKHKEIAAEYARYVASAECQTTLYFNSGGQPGHGAAWRSHEVNRRKESFAADLKQEGDRRQVLELLKHADVMVQNFRPGVIEKLGFAYETVKQSNPRVVDGEVTGYGQKGPGTWWIDPCRAC